MSINPEKEEVDARDDAAFADLLDGGGLASRRRLRDRAGKVRRRDGKGSAKGVFVGVGKKNKKGPPKKKKAGQGIRRALRRRRRPARVLKGRWIQVRRRRS
jgi:hypothetical protein